MSQHVLGNLRTAKPPSGKDIKDTKMIKGVASQDSLSGTNVITEYTTSGKKNSQGPLGGKASFK